MIPHPHVAKGEMGISASEKKEEKCHKARKIWDTDQDLTVMP